MVRRIDRARLKSERRKRNWSQEQLSAVSGVSVRTIQRLEAGAGAAPTSVSALAIAMTLTETALASNDGPIRRVTPLTIVPETEPLRRLYTELGFAVIETEDPGCIGLRAGGTHLILCSTDFLEGDFRQTNFAPLVGQTVPYLWVRSLEAAKAAFAKVVVEVSTRAGIREALVEHEGQWALLAETTS